MIAILQPLVPHYREHFFNRLRERAPFDLYCYDGAEALQKQHLAAGSTAVKSLPAWSVGPFVLYNPLRFFRSDYKVLVLMLNFAHVSTWMILLLKPFFKQKVILWGHGISVKRYVQEEQQPNLLLKWMMQLADATWFYTTREMELWRQIMPGMNAVALNNTISEVERIIQQPVPDKTLLREKYGIRARRVLIYCARFNETGRRIDLLQQLIAETDPEQYGFIIIGAGKYKPDFNGYTHVHDFGAVYDAEVKQELFGAADIYFQPGWVGLSAVEAMAYGKPVCTFKRSEAVLQCVEYSYIRDGYNGLIFDNMETCLYMLDKLSDNEINTMGQQARSFVRENLTMTAMVDNALHSLHAMNQ
ncbi:glycosyltransferase [Chitinophaga sp. 22321]|uniref:Glycosyltransferase n=1 Tax=Chitinophaga hostae TaxID=2831022 RepID=A0ABS5IVQ3_9BACT|nr:glycosyltransferase [Chitinophaga hostae]MBS0027035.1 glycosyltransferase [Chitinophaga hostae]